MSILLISAVTLMLVVSTSEISVISGEENLNLTLGQEQYFFAEGCLEEALLRLENDSTFTGTTLSYSADQSCSITVSGSNPIEVNIVVNNGAYSETYEAQIDSITQGSAINLHLADWEEI
ncbi:MAG: hypothetical protein AAB802_03400 [Patescibacteria group bacterium]